MHTAILISSLRACVTADEAVRLVGGVDHSHCQQGIGRYWQIEDGYVRPQSMLWLYCWAATGQNSQRAAEQAERAFDQIFPVSFDLMRSRIPHEYARQRRYSTRDISAEVAALLSA